MHLPKKLACCLVVASSLIAATANARLPNETVGSTKLPMPDDHRSYMVDFEFNNMVSTRIAVIDPDKQKYLGMIPTGHAAPATLSGTGKPFLPLTSFSLAMCAESAPMC